MSIIEYGESVQADCTVEGITAVNQKGGYIRCNLKIPITVGDPSGAERLTGKLATHLGNVARVTLEFSKMKTGKQGQPFDPVGEAQDRTQGKLALDGLGEDGGTADDEDLDEDTEATDEEDEAP